MGRHDTVWPVGRLVEEVSVFARWTSERAAPKDRPPLFSRAGMSRRRGRRAVVPHGDVRDVARMQGSLDVRLPAGLHLPRDSISLGVRPSASRRSVEWSRVIRSAPGRSFWRR
jgi:hypothetical protein